MIYELSYLILLLPLLSFLVLGLAGMKMQHKTAGLIGTCSLSLVTVLSYLTAITYFTAPRTAEGIFQSYLGDDARGHLNRVVDGSHLLIRLYAR